MKTFSSIKVGKTSLGAIIKKDAKSTEVRNKRITITHKYISELAETCATVYHIDFEDCFFSDNFFSHVHFIDCTFKNCVFSINTAIGSNFRKCKFFCTEIRDCIFDYCLFERCSFDDSCNINETVLRNCDFHITDFHNANIKFRNIFDRSSLKHAINPPYIKMSCPTHGSFVGWKKIIDEFEGLCLIKLEIPAKAKRSSTTSRKCRAEYAKVLGVYTLDLERIDCKKVVNTNYKRCVYEVGKIVYPDSFNENRHNECSHGIHFFIDVNDAIEY